MWTSQPSTSQPYILSLSALQAPSWEASGLISPPLVNLASCGLDYHESSLPKA